MTQDLRENWTRFMRVGRFEDAWRISDRVLRSGGASDPNAPLHLRRVWDGTPLIGRTVLVRCHHGLGDTIQFARYLPILEPLVRRLIIWAPVSLHPLLASCTQSGLLLPLENGEPDVDREVDVEIMELAHAFRTTIDTIPHSGPYLNGGARHSATRFLRVGIAWRAGNWDPRRSLPFEAAERVSRIPGAKVYSLHRELADEEARCGMLHDSRCVTVHGTAQLIRSLDLVISVDSMPAHLAGALGVSVWTLLPTEPDWRWMLDRSDSPWYPTMRLFRQPAPANWDSPIAGMRRSLETLLRSRRGPRRLTAEYANRWYNLCDSPPVANHLFYLTSTQGRRKRIWHRKTFRISISISFVICTAPRTRFSRRCRR